MSSDNVFYQDDYTEVVKKKVVEVWKCFENRAYGFLTDWK